MKKVILAILDGIGYRKKQDGNAVMAANTAFLNSLLDKYPHSLLEASGEAVGLPKGQMGNSEVGHITLGTGRIVDQPLLRINKYIENNGFYNNKVLKETINHVKDNNSKLHLFCLLSDGGVHSHINHLFNLIEVCKENNIDDLYIHVVLDGRDTPKKSALKYLDELSSYLDKNKIGKIATISGRFYAMDRENIWERTKVYYDTITSYKGVYCSSYNAIIENSYDEGITDEFIEPFSLDKDVKVEDNDAFIVCNFRPDRLLQLCEVFTKDDFNEFETKKFNNLKFVTMMPVSDNLNIPHLLEHEEITNTLGEVLANNNLRVLRIAEDAKYPHVTHFFDGDRDLILNNTDMIRIPRKRVETYDLCPEMSSYEIIDEIDKGINNYDFICVNLANGDMVGHTGNFNAAVKAVETVDKCIEKLYKIATDNNFTLIIVADHGNCEEMIGDKLTTHTTNPVHFIICDNNYQLIDGSLSNVAGSILKIMNIKIPKEMYNPIVK